MGHGLGLFSGLKRWIKKNIHIIAGVATVLGLPEVGAALEAYKASGGMNDWKISVEGLDQPSADILDNWDTTKFTPFYTELLHNLSNNVFNKGLNIIVRVQFANEILLKISAVKKYYINNGNDGLSVDGINNRLNYLEDMFNIISDKIFNDLQLSTYEQINIIENSNSLNLSLLQLNKIDFDFEATVFKISNNLNDLTPSPTTVASNPTPTIEDIKNVIENAGGSTAGISNNSTPTPTTISKPSITKALGFLLIAIGLLSSNKNSSIKNQ